MKILLWIPCASGYMHASMITSLLALRKPCDLSIQIVERQPLARSRNTLVKEALLGEYDYLFMVDDDNPLPVDALELLLEDKKDIVCWAYLTRVKKDGEHKLVAYYKNWPKYEHIKEFKDEWYLHKIDATGGWCMLISRPVLAKMYLTYKTKPYMRTDKIFDTPIVVDWVEYHSEEKDPDVEFCDRAREQGYEIRLDERVTPLHMTPPQFVKYW